MKKNPSVACLIICVFISFMSGSCAFKSVKRSKNIRYGELENNTAYHLNVFAPRRASELKPVFIFIHGGAWKSGKKSLYSFFGNRMARKDVVTVVIDYPLSPGANYHDMAQASAKAVQWVSLNIRKYGGNPDKVFISGHSAGGHLATLITVRSEYFDSLNMTNPIKGAILIDAAGLDMYGYMMEEKFDEGHTYRKTFTSDPQQWKLASPLYHLHKGMPPLLIFKGEKTYPSILKSHEKFVKALRSYTDNPKYHVQKGKKHIPMITQFFWTWNPRYDEILEFMKAVK